MPELPEVTTIKVDLKKEIEGKRVADIIRHKNFPLIPSKRDFQNNVIGHTIEKVDNIGKLLTIRLSSKKYIAVHLSMTGLLLFNKKDEYVKLTFKLSDGDELHYSTVRQFGFLELWDRDQIENYKNNKGLPILDGNLVKEQFVDLLKNRKGNIKNMLLNQKIVSGIGNIYANDALHMSNIHPETKAHQVPQSKLEKLYEKLQEILQEGIKHRGSSIDRYRDIYGKKGTQQDHFRVYGRAGEECFVCSTEIEQIKISGRSTFYCPNCQPESNQEKLL